MVDQGLDHIASFTRVFHLRLFNNLYRNESTTYAPSFAVAVWIWVPVVRSDHLDVAGGILMRDS